MYVCVCNAISSDDIKRDPALITSCGTKCGRCIPYIQSNCFPGVDVQIFTSEELSELYTKSIAVVEKS
jgi:hypothetical protein